MELKNRAQRLYYPALRADRVFSKEIRRVFGPRATRWTITLQEQIDAPTVWQARCRMIALGNAFHRASMRLNRVGF